MELPPLEEGGPVVHVHVAPLEVFELPRSVRRIAPAVQPRRGVGQPLVSVAQQDVAGHVQLQEVVLDGLVARVAPQGRVRARRGSVEREVRDRHQEPVARRRVGRRLPPAPPVPGFRRGSGGARGAWEWVAGVLGSSDLWGGGRRPAGAIEAVGDATSGAGVVDGRVGR